MGNHDRSLDEMIKNKVEQNEQSKNYARFARNQVEGNDGGVDEEIKSQDREPDQQNRLKDKENRRT